MSRKYWSSWQTPNTGIIGKQAENTNILKQLNTTERDSEHEIYLLNINNLEEVKFKIIPDSVAEDYKQQIVSETPYGIYSPLYFYGGGSGRTLSFQFELHEDENHEQGSLYKLIDKIKRMGEALYLPDADTGVEALKEPLVYFQLGTQFAGKGFINTKFDFNKPFRQGRFIYAKVEMTFTYIEEYKSDSQDFHKELDYLTPEAPSISMNELLDEPSIADFFSEGGYDIFVTNDYAFKKLENFLSYSLYTTDLDQIIKDYEDYLGNPRDNSTIGVKYSSAARLAYITNPFLKELAYIAASDHLTIQTKVNNLKLLKKRVEESEDFQMNGGVQFRTLGADHEGRRMLIEIYNDLLKQIDTQIQIFTIMGGADS